jgi:hypothetical protein
MLTQGKAGKKERSMKNAAKTGDFSEFWIPVMAVFIAHNIAEVYGDMPKWGKEHFAVLNGVGTSQFEFGVLISILVLVLVAVAFFFRKNLKITRILLMIFTIFMIVNCIWHACVSLYAGSPSPGLLEALILGLPVYSYTLYLVIRYEKMNRVNPC